MSRIVVVTGAGSGIGAICAKILRDQGNEVIGLDLKGSDIEVDLTDAEAIRRAAEQIEHAHGYIDGLIANAGVQTSSTLDLKVNFFGAVDTINAFLPLLAKSDAARISVTASAASLQPSDPELLKLLLQDQREDAFAYGDNLKEKGQEAGYVNYSTAKRAIAQWVRRVAPTDEFAGAGIGINAVGPGVVATPMTKELLSTEEGRALAFGNMPAPYNGAQEPEDIANVLVFLVSKENNAMTGQIIYVDGGFDSIGRGEDIWHSPKSMD